MSACALANDADVAAWMVATANEMAPARRAQALSDGVCNAKACGGSRGRGKECMKRVAIAPRGPARGQKEI